VDDGRPASTVEHFDPNKDVGNRALQAGELYSLSGQTVGAGVDPAAFDQGVC
jgi:hypothetical protein